MAFRNDHDRMIYIICTVWDNDFGKKTILIKSPCHLKHTALFKQWDKNKIVYYSNNIRVCSEINGIISSSISSSLCGFHCLSIHYICQSLFNFRPYKDNWWAASWLFQHLSSSLPLFHRYSAMCLPILFLLPKSL